MIHNSIFMKFNIFIQMYNDLFCPSFDQQGSVMKFNFKSKE